MYKRQLYRQQGLSGKPEPFLDPNTLSDQGTVALIDVSFSKDDRYLAYAAASAGSDWVEIRVMETATGRTLPDVIRWVKFSGAVWSGEGFYYSGYDEPDRAQLLSGQNRDQKVYYHRLGTPQDADELVYSDPQHPLRYLSASVSRDGRMLFITATEEMCIRDSLHDILRLVFVAQRLEGESVEVVGERLHTLFVLRNGH